MTVTNTTYCTAAQLKQYIGKTTPTDDTLIDWAVEAATQAIDNHCGRNFTNDDTASARTFQAVSSTYAIVADFHTTDGLVVKTDDNDDGVFETTWTSADYELEPFDGRHRGIGGFPFWKIRAVNYAWFPVCNQRRGVLQVTAKWGWASVPDNVFQAALILAQEFHRLREAPFGVAGVDAFGPIRVRDNTRVASLLRPFVLESDEVHVA